MKMKKYLFLLVAVASLGLTTGCDDDDDRTVPVPDAVADTFGGMYPNASDVEWTGRNGYLIADFRDGNTDMQAWFTAGGDWRMTETDLLYDQLPEAVRKAFGERVCRLAGRGCGATRACGIRTGLRARSGEGADRI